jgi:hypothetical protein
MGTLVWRFTKGFDLDLDPKLLDEQPPRQVMLHYGYIHPQLNRFILCCDDNRFANRSNTPNIGIEFEADPYGLDVAAGDLEAGKELTVDYEFVEGSRPAVSLTLSGAHPLQLGLENRRGKGCLCSDRLALLYPMLSFALDPTLARWNTRSGLLHHVASRAGQGYRSFFHKRLQGY